MIGSNSVLLAAAGSGKTQHLVREALKVKEDGVLITTYTESNESEIRQKFIEINGHIPPNVVVMTWFTFLINHGVKPFQGGLFDFSVKGMLLVSNRSGLRATDKLGRPIYWSEDYFSKHYFDSGHRIYSDKLSKLVIRCNQVSDGDVVDRISRVFRHIFVDEVQDLAGYDLDILGALFRSAARVLLVGDPRQVTYLTHHEAKHEKYANGGLVRFLREKLPKKIPFDLDEDTLSRSHRNSEMICSLSSKLYPDMKPSAACTCESCRSHVLEGAGIFIVRRADYVRYLETYQPMQLRDKVTSAGVDQRFPVMNFGASKGLGFDRVIILPTEPMLKWIRDVNAELKPTTRAKFYVALTRSRHSVAIVADWHVDAVPAGYSLFA
ncbi:MAG: UvrD-helicase domain-containing protein [Polaromonas sp.]|uniref:UvrD-helicase domain-containing protein n=1 Tax=Polaromonas sp. TaxID=1869339 RepID=UPI002730DC15|nr:UvrD-helicase domain-containing protein [Polaromonas sp.]MDP2451004.1 UvrD-helicase domain-containing protein [Polaromonas sp.]MDP3248509.1 UvrD-helicase domain-containing protein [Polaromonas sp.]MDP3757413.1 UvrD-helicase domain-containing protein [Polaromonas sp.]